MLRKNEITLSSLKSIVYHDICQMRPIYKHNWSVSLISQCKNIIAVTRSFTQITTACRRRGCFWGHTIILLSLPSASHFCSQPESVWFVWEVIDNYIIFLLGEEQKKDIYLVVVSRSQKKTQKKEERKLKLDHLWCSWPFMRISQIIRGKN